MTTHPHQNSIAKANSEDYTAPQQKEIKKNKSPKQMI